MPEGRWWRRLTRPKQPTHRVMLFPHAGGSSTYYRELAACLPASIEVLGVQYPGRQDRLADRLIDDLHQLADAVVGAELVVPAIRADFAAAEAYACPAEATVACPIATFAGAEDRTVTPDGIKAWSGHTTGGWSERCLPGGHFFFRDAPAQLAEAVARAIADAVGQEGLC
jgi:surfactin synthase thioesterase subunit